MASQSSTPRACVDERRVAVDQLLHPVEHSKVCRGKDVDNRASLDQRRRLFGRTVGFHEPEPAGPPRAFEVQIRAVGQQQVEQRHILRRSCDRPAVEMADRLVHGCPHIGVFLEQRPDALHVALMQRDEEPFDRRLAERIDFVCHRRTSLEPG